MNEYTQEQLTRICGILKSIGLQKEQIFGIMSMLETEEMATELVEKIAEKNFNLTPQETMNLFAQIVKKHKVL